ncbi:MAG TPA: phage tail protein [Xanthobacteraceae bacterium]|nr:phage tail protein [Xanthobacteraceae bacterium]
MTEPVFGLTFMRDDNEPRPVVASDMSVVGLVGTAPDADEAKFPLDQPVLMFSSDRASLTALGTTGTIPDAIRLLNLQLGDNQISAKVVVVRIAEGDDDLETIANILGDEGAGSGLYALLRAGPDLGAIPRLLGVPDYTHQLVAGIGDVMIVGGEDYATAPTATITGGSPVRPAVVDKVTVQGGKVTAISFTDRGLYLSSPTITFAGGGGSGASATVTLEQTGNAVCAALAGITTKLSAHAVVEGPGTTSIAIKNWREGMQSPRLIPIDARVKVAKGAGVAVVSGVGAVLGIAVRRDHEFRGVPSRSWANQPIHGIIGPARSVAFSLVDGATEGQDLLAANVGILVRGELGVESAIANSGFVFIGTDNAADDPVWQFYNVTRMRDYIELGFMRTLRFYLGRYNITGHAIQAVLNTMGFNLRDLRADNHILGYRVGFEPDKNSPENLRLGRFRCYFMAEEAPVLRRIDVDSRRYRPALDRLVQDLMSQIGEISG